MSLAARRSRSVTTAELDQLSSGRFGPNSEYSARNMLPSRSRSVTTAEAGIKEEGKRKSFLTSNWSSTLESAHSLAECALSFWHEIG